jgi:hypothetical protein
MRANNPRRNTTRSKMMAVKAAHAFTQRVRHKAVLLPPSDLELTDTILHRHATQLAAVRCAPGR